MSSNVNTPSSLPPLDSNLTMLFKGFIVTLSPLVGWGALKLISFVFNHPQYFILTWLTALAIGLVAEFFKEARRPARLSRLRSNRINQSSRENSTESSSVSAKRVAIVANQKSDTNDNNGNSPTTVLFKSTTRPDSENNVPGEGDDDAEESEPTTVHVETRVKMSKRSRSRSSCKTCSGKNKGFGKPVVVRMNYQMDADPSLQKVPTNNNPMDGTANRSKSAEKTPVNMNTMHSLECMTTRPKQKQNAPVNASTPSSTVESTRSSQKAQVNRTNTITSLEQSITRTLIADESNGNNNSSSTKRARSKSPAKVNSRYLFGKLDKTNDGDNDEVELALEADQISDDDVQQDLK